MKRFVVNLSLAAAVVAALAAPAGRAIAQEKKNIETLMAQADADKKKGIITVEQWGEKMKEIVMAGDDNLTSAQLRLYAQASARAAMQATPDEALAMLPDDLLRKASDVKVASAIHGARANAFYNKKNYAGMAAEINQMDMEKGEPRYVGLCYRLQLLRLSEAGDSEGYLALLDKALTSDCVWKFRGPAVLNGIAMTVAQGIPIDRLTADQKKRAAGIFAKAAVTAASRGVNDLAAIFRTLMLQYQDAGGK